MKKINKDYNSKLEINIENYKWRKRKKWEYGTNRNMNISEKDKQKPKEFQKSIVYPWSVIIAFDI